MWENQNKEIFLYQGVEATIGYSLICITIDFAVFGDFPKFSGSPSSRIRIWVAGKRYFGVLQKY